MRRIALFLVVFAVLKASALTLSRGATEIAVASDAPKTVLFAAKELKHFLEGAFGEEVSVVTTPTVCKAGIRLGAKATGFDVSAFARDEFRIRVSETGVDIAGRDDGRVNPEKAMTSSCWAQYYERATLFGVYEFLERYAGVRMYFPGELGEVVPRRDEIAIAAADFRVKPDMTVKRSFSFCEEGVWFEGEKRDKGSTLPLRWLNTYRHRYETDFVPFCHGLSQRGYPERFGESHPEYFARKTDGSRLTGASRRFAGQLCHTSRVWEEIYLDAKSFLEGEAPTVRGIISPNGKPHWWYGTHGKYVDIMPQDGMERCTCESCEAAYDRDDAGNYMDTLIWTRTAEVGRRLIRDGVPGFVTQMAYQPYRRVPDVDIPTNVLVMVAERGPWSVPYPEQTREEYDEIAAWAKKLGRRIALWTYPCKYSSRKIQHIPDLSPWQWGEYYTAVAPHVDGIYAESETDRFLYKHLDYYVLGKVMWNPKGDYNALIDEYFRLMYGPAESEMRRIFRAFQKAWTQGLLRRGAETMWGPSFEPAEAEDIWMKVYSRKVLARFAEFFDAAAAKTSGGSLERRRVELMRRELLEPLLKAARAKWAHYEALPRYRLGSGEKAALAPYPAKKDASPIVDPVATTFVASEKDDRIVVEIDCQEPRMEDAVAQLSPHDCTVVGRRNCVELLVVPEKTPGDIYIIYVDSAGSVDDLVMHWGAYPRTIDIEWNPTADVAVSSRADGWTCRIALPVDAIPGLGARPRVEVIRNRVLKDGLSELYHWSAPSAAYSDWRAFGRFVRGEVRK